MKMVMVMMMKMMMMMKMVVRKHTTNEHEIRRV